MLNASSRGGGTRRVPQPGVGLGVLGHQLSLTPLHTLYRPFGGFIMIND